MCICCRSNTVQQPGNHRIRSVYSQISRLCANHLHILCDVSNSHIIKLLQYISIWVVKRKTFHNFYWDMWYMYILKWRLKLYQFDHPFYLTVKRLKTLPSSSYVGHSKHTPKVLHEDHPRHREVGANGDVEATISIQKAWIVPIQGHIL